MQQQQNTKSSGKLKCVMAKSSAHLECSPKDADPDLGQVCILVRWQNLRSYFNLPFWTIGLILASGSH